MAAVPSMLTVDRNVRLHAQHTPQKVAIRDSSCSRTYQELIVRIDKLASAFMRLGLKKGDRIAVLLRNRVEWTEILLACATTGIVCVPINSRFVDTEIAYALKHSGANAIVSEAALAAGVDRVRDQLDLIPPAGFLHVGDDRMSHWSSYEEAIRNASPLSDYPEVNDSDCWYLGYTSGTTGKPKATILNHRAKTLGVLHAAIEYQLGDSDSTLLVMPLFHSNGIFFQLLLLSIGGTVVIADEFDAEGVLRAIDEHRITVISLVPTMYAMILGLPQTTKQRYQISSLRVVISSSAPLLAKTKEEMLAFFPGAELHEFYGSTEAGFVSNLKPRDQMRKLRSVGQPFLGTEVRLLDEHGDDVPAGKVGELWSRGITHSYDGYLNDPEATSAAYRDGGWFSAGDLAMRDDEGYLYIVDRKKDLIISGGENIFPTEVENVLIRHRAIAEIAVVGVPDEIWGERVCAVARLHPGMALTLDELRQWAKGHMAGYKCPRELKIWDDLPKSPTGKLLRRAIRDRLTNNHPVGG